MIANFDKQFESRPAINKQILRIYSPEMTKKKFELVQS